MSFVVESRVEDYAVALSSPRPLDELFERLAAETRERTSTPRMMVGPLDLVFIDADKEGYLDYYEAALPLLADDGLIVADNVLWSGRVAEDDPDERTRTIMAFNDHVRNDDRVVAVMLTVRDGMTLIRKR